MSEVHLYRGHLTAVQEGPHTDGLNRRDPCIILEAYTCDWMRVVAYRDTSPIRKRLPLGPQGPRPRPTAES